MNSDIAIAAQERVCRDLLAFADPRTTVEVRDNEFYWTLRRKPRILKVLDLGEDGFPSRVEFEGRQVNYPDLFAMEEMGALLWLAQEVERSLALHKLSYPTETVAAKVQAEDAPITTTFEAALMEVMRTGRDRTSLVFLQGRAGDGKSTSLIDLAHKQAAEYAAGRASHIYLYIDAQGRSLSRLDEAVALILDDLNATFRYQSLAVLTRLGLIVPIVDGFDELLGSGGYAEAFASLEAFLLRLEGQGTVVTSARSTFFQQSALSRAAARLSAQSSTANISIHNIQLLPWDHDSTEQLLQKLDVAPYLDDVRPDEAYSHFSAARRAIGPGSDEILSSPLLTAAYASLLKEGRTATAHGSIVEAAISALVQREIKTKLLGARGDQILNESQFEQLFSSVAEEMWWQETRALDEDTLVLVADMTLESLGIDKTKASALLNKLKSNAVIELGEGSRKLSFRHEIYFSYFLGSYFKTTLLNGTQKDIARLLSRSLLPATLSRQVSWLIRTQDECSKYLNVIASPAGQSAASDLINSNRGSLIAGALKYSELPPTLPTIVDATFRAVDFSQIHIGQIEFHRCSFEDADMTGLDAPLATFVDCALHQPLVDESTNLNLSGLTLGREIVGIRVRLDGVERVLYRAAQAPDLFQRLQLRDSAISTPKSLTDRERRSLDSIERILRFASRSIYFSETDFENRNLPKEFLSVGAKYQLWTESEKQRRGVRTVYRLNKEPDAIISGALGETADADVAAFWNDVFASN